MEFIDKAIEEYAIQHTEQENELLHELNRQTHIQVLQPRMLSGHLQGRVLSMLSKMIAPKTILEIGTYTGYSALCLAEGLRADGKLITLDVDYELEPFTRSFFNRSEFAQQIDFRIGNALELIPEIKEELDIVFIDADKSNYIRYFDLVIDQVKPGGYIIADNVLWSGKVLESYEELDIDTKVIVDYNNKIQQDERVENVLIPLRDGLMVARKK